MRPATFFLLVLILSGLWIWWRMADWKTRAEIAWFVKRHARVFIIVFFVMAIALMVVSQFSIKVF